MLKDIHVSPHVGGRGRKGFCALNRMRCLSVMDTNHDNRSKSSAGSFPPLWQRSNRPTRCEMPTASKHFVNAPCL